MPDGSVILVEIARSTVSRVTPDGAISVVAETGGGPNGAAVGPDGKLYVCNNGGLPWTQLPDGSWYPIDAATGSMTPAGYRGGSIDRVDLRSGALERLYERDADGEPLSAPNDVVFDAAGHLWFTDTGKTDARRTTLGAVHRATTDGSHIDTVAFGLLGPNGIGLSPDGGTLVEGTEPVLGPKGSVTQQVDYVTADHREFVMHVSNQADPKGESAQLAPRPPLTTDEMIAIVTSDKW